MQLSAEDRADIADTVAALPETAFYDAEGEDMQARGMELSDQDGVQIRAVDTLPPPFSSDGQYIIFNSPSQSFPQTEQ